MPNAERRTPNVGTYYECVVSLRVQYLFVIIVRAMGFSLGHFKTYLIGCYRKNRSFTMKNYYVREQREHVTPRPHCYRCPLSIVNVSLINLRKIDIVQLLERCVMASAIRVSYIALQMDFVRVANPYKINAFSHHTSM